MLGNKKISIFFVSGDYLKNVSKLLTISDSFGSANESTLSSS